MADQKWGHCKHCKYFASPARIPLDAEEARCLHPVLSKYELEVFGASGCSGFELRPGLPADVEQPGVIT
jgi:hypothetical protein